MKKAAIAIAMLLTTSLGSVAHPIDLGFVNKQGGTSTDMKANGKTAAEAAIRLPKEMLTRYANPTGAALQNTFRSVRVELPALKNLVDSIVVWVRTAPDGESLATAVATRFKDDGKATLLEGWNELSLAQPVNIEADKDYYIGYTYYQRTKTCATQYYYRGTTGYSFINIGEGWQPWTEGALCIEAGIDGEAMPLYDFDLQGAKGLIEGDGTVAVQTRLANLGQQSATQLTFRVEAGSYVQTVDVDAQTLPNTLDTLRFELPNAAGSIQVGTEATVTLTAIDGQVDAWTADNAAQVVFNYPRTLLIEEFTTEQCPNCPALSALFHEFLHGGSELGKQSVMVCHHAGYHTDEFTTQDDLAYEWFYNNDGATYAPAAMFNRRPVKETSYGETPCIHPQSIEEINGLAEYCLADPSTLILTATVEDHTADGFVSLTVKGRQLDGFNITNPRIFVYLTEDNVLSTNGQAGSGTDTYYHQHVVRGQNATWGDPLKWDNGAFTYNTSFDLEDAWKIGDMTLIASVGNYDETNPANCVIENTVAVRLKDVVNSINAKDVTEKPVSYTYYNLAGAQLDRPAHGVTIVKGSDGSTRKVIKR